MLNYTYYKNDKVMDKVTQRLGNRAKDHTIFTGRIEVMNEMIKVVHQWGNPRQRVRATLQQVYNYAIRNMLREAREILMKTHMSQVIIMQPIENQILYNRALVQIGIAAFRMGKVKESHEILADICQNSRHKELLAQRISSIMDKSVEFE